ncbi:MAG TPA: penicillin acylase family protein [Vicinamibacterales bacterium]|nr:penicillin acylase family protein [Vicinamibacterales bacterium]
MPVTVVRDQWGVAHIRAGTRDDLFLAQGFVQASDRLFQMDLWRRASQGRLAEILGSNFISRDAMTRRIQYTGDLDEEWASYGPDVRAIASAFVRGVNAWVRLARDRPPESFRLAGWLPELWRPEDLLSRTDAFLASSDALAEIFRARLVTAVGPERASALVGDDSLRAVPTDVDLAAITFQVADLLRQIGTQPFLTTVQGAGGSNAWAIATRRSTTGGPLLATDPHRLLTNPSLRYLVHLTAPGWNVIGATAPWLPGVAVGHNDRVAWGMTAYNADTADVYVERLNPDNSHQVEVAGRWQNTTVVVEPLWVKGRTRPIPFQREYTPHGVVIGVDRDKHLAFTLKWSGLEPGAAAELASATLDRADSGAAFRSALSRWRTPSVEVLYAERGGEIGSQVAALVPIRRGWNGKLPVAGWTERTEWSGWQTLDDLPHTADPVTGYLLSANQNRARTERLRAALSSSGPFAVEELARLQHDTLAWNAQRLVPLLERLRSPRADVEQSRDGLLRWDRRMSVDSVDATVYASWERRARRLLVESRVPGELVDEFLVRSHDRVVPALLAPSAPWFSGNAARARDTLLLQALVEAVDGLKAEQDDASRQQVVFAHPLGITAATRPRFNVGPFPRLAYGDTLMSISGRLPEAAVGASFRAVFDGGDWDRSLVLNAPGQSESPASAHFSDLARLWAQGNPFPLAFSEAAIAASAESTLTLTPAVP